MHERLYQYTHAVCRYVNHATGKEKAAIRKELTDHMEDHAQALLDGGFPEDHAYRVAVESMGDPETVGKALNKEYPLHWLILSRLFLGLAICGVLLVCTVFPWGFFDSLMARTAPMYSSHHDTGIPLEDLTPTDCRMTLPNGDVIYVYATNIRTVEGEEGYLVDIYTATYNKNPLRDPYYTSNQLNYSPKIGEHHPGAGNDPLGKFTGANYRHHVGKDVPVGSDLEARFDRYGETVTMTIPLNWEEVDAP